MKKLTMIALAVSTAISFGTQANNFHGPNGIKHINGPTGDSTVKTTPAKPSKAYGNSSYSQAQSSTDIVPQTCSYDEYASYSGNDFVEYVSNAYLHSSEAYGYDCFRPLFESFDQAAVVFSEENITNVANALVVELDTPDYIPERIYGKLMYLRVMYYNYITHGGSFSIPADESAVKSAIDTLLSVYTGNSLDPLHHMILAETVIAAGSYFTHMTYHDETNPSADARTSEFASLVGPIKVGLQNIINMYDIDANTQDQTYGLYTSANAMMNETNRMVRYFVGADVYTDVELPGLIAQFIYNLEIDDPVPSNATYAFTGFFEYGTTDALVEATQTMIDSTDKFSQIHVAMLGAIDTFNVDCTIFDRDASLCVTDDLIAEMRAFALPNEFTFGNITFVTKMDEARTQHIYNTLQATRSQFFRDTGITDPVENDPNDNVTFVVYGSPTEYQAFQSYLYGLDSNNGGIYIEQDGALYTFDRADTEQFVLEELARHEYAHYLISRYLVNGMWGETDMYANDRMVWFDEGLANFVTGATQHEGNVVLSTMVQLQRGKSERSVSEITNASYGDDWMYPYSALLFNYMATVDTSYLVDLSQALVADSTTQFDAVVGDIASLDGGFQAYVDAITDSEWEAPWYQYMTGSELEMSGVAEIQEVLSAEMGYAATCTETTETSFSCTFTINDVDAALADQVDIVNTTLNVGIVASLSAGPNNFETMTCHPTNFSTETVDAECIGILRSDDVDYDDGEEEPVDSDGDGVPDDEDAFPNDPTEWADTDGDGYGDNGDAFPNDSSEWADTDGDGYGDNGDVFPNDSTEWVDTDGDGYGDNGDAFPNDSTEWVDTDGDGYGDNQDEYPNDASKWEKETTTTTPTPEPTKAESSKSGGSTGIVMILLGLVGVVLRRFKM